MPYTFTQIEREKSRIVFFLTSFLTIFYFGCFYLLGVAYKNYVLFSRNEDLSPVFVLNTVETVLVVIVAITVGSLQVMSAAAHSIDNVLKVLRTQKPDPGNAFHRRFQNIVEEVSLASGRQGIEGVIVPSTALNAFALDDGDGRSVIGITEGLTTRCTRAQVEAVVAHEAAHIVTGDCYSVTVVSSVFEVFTSILNGIKYTLLGIEDSIPPSSSGRGVPVSYPGRPIVTAEETLIAGDAVRETARSFLGFLVFAVFVYWLLCFAGGVSRLLKLFISREKKFRADAVAVRLSRDPVSLAEVLYIISKGWKGAGTPWESLQSIFIANPGYQRLDESEGLFADLFSAHPPIEKRIEVLLSLAHVEAEVLDKALKDNIQKNKTDDFANMPFRWFLSREGAWVGPHNIAEIEGLLWVTSATLVKRMGSERLSPLSEDKALRAAWKPSVGDQEKSGLLCPECKHHLNGMTYERVSIFECPECRGTLVHDENIYTILNTKQGTFSDAVVHLANVLREQSSFDGKKAATSFPEHPACPKCANPMSRSFFNAFYPVEVDRCRPCGVIWFNKDEFEILQYMFEERLKGESGEK